MPINIPMTDGKVIMYAGKVGGDTGYHCCRSGADCNITVEWDIEVPGYGSSSGTDTIDNFGYVDFFEYYPATTTTLFGSLYFECQYPCFWRVEGFFCYASNYDEGGSEMWEGFIPMECGCPKKGDITDFSGMDPPTVTLITTLKIV